MSALHWFEIPVSDIERAKKFYDAVLDTHIPVMDMTAQMGSMLGMLPNRDGIGGALVQNTQHGYTPSQQGTMVYLVVESDLNDSLGKVEGAGGQVILPKTPMGESQDAGFTAWIIDTEGNKIGLFSRN